MKKNFLSILGIIPLFVFSVNAQEGAFNIQTGDSLSTEEWEAMLPDSFDLFNSETPLAITVESDFKNLSKRKYKDEYQEALLHYQLNDNIVVKRKIRIKARGVFRKKFCFFPPIRLNFKKAKLDVKGLQELEKLKMVTNCKNSSTYEVYLLKEYLIYKMYNLLTDMSFKARLLKVRYIDTGRKNKTWETFAFIIEEADKMAARSKAAAISMKKLSQPNLEARHMTMVAVFNYMIGNTDWSVPGQHNMKLIKVLDLNAPKPYPVPYDFDYAGFVDTDYAVPRDGLGTDNVRERVYLGYCRTPEEYQEAFAVFLEKEQALYDIVQDFQYLSKREKEIAVDYLGSFFKQIKGPKAGKNLFSSSCKR